VVPAVRHPSGSASSSCRPRWCGVPPGHPSTGASTTRPWATSAGTTSRASRCQNWKNHEAKAGDGRLLLVEYPVGPQCCSRHVSDRYVVPRREGANGTLLILEEGVFASVMSRIVTIVLCNHPLTIT
jgi:hypothetical protein